MTADHDPIVRALFDRTLAANAAGLLATPVAISTCLSEQLTIFGPFGGPALRGRDPRAAARVAGLFSNGTAEIELVDAIVADDIVCLVMVERCEANFAGVEERHRWDLRTTQIYRRCGDAWQVVHRHAEPLTVSRDLAQTLALLEEPDPERPPPQR